MYVRDAKLKIAQVITRMDNVGGAQIHVRDIASHLQLHGHSVYLITGNMKNVHQGLKNIPIYHVKHLVREFHPLADIQAFFEMRKVFKKLDPDIVATHSSKAGIIGRLAAKSLRIPSIFTAHGWSFTEGIPNPQKALYQLIEKLVGTITNGVIAVSEYDKQLAIRRKVIPEGKITSIQNGVHNCPMKPPQLFNNVPRLTMIARFDFPKKQISVLESLSRLQHLEWTMYFVGDGAEKKKAEQYAKELGIAHRVVFEGWRKDVVTVLEETDVFILISLYEGLPLSILEAMRAGLPIIAADVGGVKEAVKAENGVLVETDDHNGLKNAIERLIKDKDLRTQMGAKSRKLFEEKFTFEKMMEETLSLYRTIAGKEESE